MYRVAKSRYPGIQDTGHFWKEIRTFSNSCCKSQHIWHKKASTLLIYDTVQLQMNKLEKKTGICSISCIILCQNPENTYFGHFIIENHDTVRTKSFCNSGDQIISKTFSNSNNSGLSDREGGSGLIGNFSHFFFV